MEDGEGIVAVGPSLNKTNYRYNCDDILFQITARIDRNEYELRKELCIIAREREGGMNKRALTLLNNDLNFKSQYQYREETVNMC